MTDKERELALYCLKASSDYHSEVCEECINYPNCDHMIQDDVMETLIKALEQEPCDKYIKEIDHLRKYISKLETQIVEQEPSGDLISLETVIEWLKTKDIIKLFSQEETARRELKDLSSVKQEPRWIPVSERLPEDGIPCICTVYNTDIYRDNIQVYDNYLVYDEYTEQWIDDDMELCPYEVLAWMPLPKSYKAESEDKE